MTSTERSSGWAATRAARPSDEPRDEWQNTRAQTALATQFLRDKDDYLEGEVRDIGRQVGANERELFVSCDPGPALEQQFEHLRPEFIAVHDIGTASSRRLVAGIAAAASRAVQKLYIRRQGFGTPLATLEYVELPTPPGARPLRLYTTECDADTSSRHAIARTLLAHSRLAVVMVGELPPHALDAAFRPLHDEVASPGWHNRNLLLLPLSAGGAVAAQGVELGRDRRVSVVTTPQVTRPADAWNFINGAWTRLRNSTAADPSAAPATPAPAAPTGIRAPLSMRPMPPVPTAADRAAALAAEPRTLLERYAQRITELTGVVSCCVFELSSGKPRAHAGASPGADDLARHGSELLASLTGTAREMGLGHALPDAAITLGAHHLLLRGVPRHPQLALHVVLDKAQANLTLARLQISRIDAMFDDA